MPAANSAQTQTAAQASQSGGAPAGQGAQTAEPPTPPPPADGAVTVARMDKAAEWAAYAAAARCAQEIGRQVAAAAGKGGENRTVLVVDLPAALSAAAPPPTRLEADLDRWIAALDSAARNLDGRLAAVAAAWEGDGGAKEGGGQEAAFGQGASGAQAAPPAMTPLDPAALLSMAAGAAAALAAGVPGALAALPAVAAALPGVAAGVGSMVNLGAAALAHLRADHAVEGAAVAVSEQALVTAVCGALASSGVPVRLLDPAAVEGADVLARFDAAAWKALEVKAKVEALTFAAQVYAAQAQRQEAQRDALWARRWGAKAAAQGPADPQGGGAGNGAARYGAPVGEGMLSMDAEAAQPQAAQDGAPDTPPPAADDGGAEILALEMEIAALDERIAESRASHLLCALAVKGAAALTAAFDAAAAKLAANEGDGLSPLALAALREAAAKTQADYLLYVKLHSVGGETAARSRSLLSRGGAAALTGHAAASFVLVERATGCIAAADTVGRSASIRLDAGDAKFGDWGYAEFGRGAMKS